MHAIDQELRDFILNNFLYGQPIALDESDSLLEKGIIDSTGVLELVSFLEERYAVKIEDDELHPDNLDSIANLKQFLTRKLNGRAVSEKHVG